MGPKYNCGYPYKRQAEGDLVSRHSEECEDRDSKILALRIGMMQPQVKECRHPPEAGRGKEIDSSLDPPEPPSAH